ncbi:MAG TPA: Nif3-like dinuclear metal center hexameric protein [Candidatus Cloacimonadota bacterium]|nr:Nif3-like dinuclear metal center hexameric protein [Candidatus Cloacimonadota bacterium]
MKMEIKEILREIEGFAPLTLAMSWDNVGLLVGDASQEVSKAVTCLDVDDNAVNKAIEVGAELIVSHHPLIFRAINRITNPLLLKLIEHGIAVISLHTNLDVAPKSVNQVLADSLGLTVIEHLSHETGNTWHRFSLTVPVDDLEQVRQAIFSSGAGLIGLYDNCSQSHRITGTYRALEGSNPYIKGEGTMSVDEYELEFMVDESRLGATIEAIKNTHPYETPAFYHYPVSNANPAYGLGLVCENDSGLSLSQLQKLCRDKLHNPAPRLYLLGKDAAFIPQRIAICGGSGGSLISVANRKADLFISGDFSYHQIFDSGLPLIDAGHFFTEYPVVHYLAEKLQEMGLEADILEMDKHKGYIM